MIVDKLLLLAHSLLVPTPDNPGVNPSRSRSRFRLAAGLGGYSGSSTGVTGIAYVHPQLGLHAAFGGSTSWTSTTRAEILFTPVIALRRFAATLSPHVGGGLVVTSLGPWDGRGIRDTRFGGSGIVGLDLDIHGLPLQLFTSGAVVVTPRLGAPGARITAGVRWTPLPRW